MDKAAERRSRVALACFVAALPLFLAMAVRRANLPAVSSSDGRAAATVSSQFKLPAAVAEALAHYATSNATPQLTAAEVGVALRVLRRRAPCNLLVFGLGLDSALRAALNAGGRTVFLEEDASWIKSVEAAHPHAGIESYHVPYDTVLADADALLALRADPACVAQPGLAAAAAAGCRLVPRGLPPVFREVAWDVILVDAPTGYDPTRPGRMGVIYAAGMAARARRGGATEVLVHDVDRPVEDRFSRVFLCEAYAVEEAGKLRRFLVPGRRSDDGGAPFCPLLAGNASTADA